MRALGAGGGIGRMRLAWLALAAALVLVGCGGSARAQVTCGTPTYAGGGGGVTGNLTVMIASSTCIPSLVYVYGPYSMNVTSCSLLGAAPTYTIRAMATAGQATPRNCGFFLSVVGSTVGGGACNPDASCDMIGPPGGLPVELMGFEVESNPPVTTRGEPDSQDQPATPGPE